MTLIRWQPYRELDQLRQQLDRFFDASPLTQSGFPTALVEGSWRTPPAELHETETEFTLKLELPGIDPQDLTIEATAESVSISGERQASHQVEANGSVRSEFQYGKFQRTIALPSRIQNTQVKADYQQGILVVTLPKTEEEKTKVVKVAVNS